MKWIGERISYVDKDNKTTFVILPDNVGWQRPLMGAWFFMWIGIGIAICTSFAVFNYDRQEQLILVVFMVFWLYYLLRVGRTFFWLLYGKELVKVDQISLVIKNSIRGYGKAKEFYLENIEKIRVSIPKANSFQSAWENSSWIRGGERLEFDYRGKTIRLGRKLSEQEAKLLFQVLTKRVEDHLRRKK